MDTRPLFPSAHHSTMINTYQSSMAPPPVPPRYNRSHPVLVPAPAASHNYTKSLLRFLVGVVLLHLVLSVTGFIWLYKSGKILVEENYQPHHQQEPEDVHLLQQQQISSKKVLARMVLQRTQKKPESKPGYLQWDTKYSQYSLEYLNYYSRGWLTIMESGDYYVYSRVTFSSSNMTSPLVNRVMFKKSKTEKEKMIMQAFCHMDRGSSQIPGLCTASQGDVIKLERGNELSVWVEDLSLVDYDEGATTFGLYSL